MPNPINEDPVIAARGIAEYRAMLGDAEVQAALELNLTGSTPGSTLPDTLIVFRTEDNDYAHADYYGTDIPTLAESMSRFGISLIPDGRDIGVYSIDIPGNITVSLSALKAEFIRISNMMNESCDPSLAKGLGMGMETWISTLVGTDA